MRSLAILWLSTAAMLAAQGLPSSTVSTLAQTAEKRTNEWSVLASNLEQRVARMLPCDTRVPSAVEEVSRASDARFAAVMAYWREIAKRANDQVETARKLIADNDARAADWKADVDDSEQEQLRVQTQMADLRGAARQQAALSSAARILNGISEKMAAAVKQGSSRQTAAEKLNSEINAFITAAQARQTAINAELSALSTESARWTTYYTTRIARAQMECSITAGPDDVVASPRNTKKGGR